MYRCLTLLVGLCFSGNLFAGDGKTPPPEASDMKVLFNGKDLAGWDGDTRLWTVKDGVLRGETTKDNAAKGNTFIIWKNGTLKDFDLRLSFRMNASNNSGIQYRSKHITEGKVSNSWVVGGYQHELRNQIKFPDTPSFIYDERGKRGRMCEVGEKVVWADGKKNVKEKFLDQETFNKLMRLDDWNDVVIVAKGNNIKHYLNGQKMVDFTDEDPKLALLEGILALQLHAGAPMWVEFKNIRLKSLDTVVAKAKEPAAKTVKQASGATTPKSIPSTTTPAQSTAPATAQVGTSHGGGRLGILARIRNRFGR